MESTQTRNTAYFTHQTKESQCDRVAMYLKESHNGLTIGELSAMMNLPKSTISGRIGDLKPSVVENGTRLDESTNNTVVVWKWIGEQTELFKNEKLTPSKKIKIKNELCLELPCLLSEKISNILNQK